jgi:hypothetical protein
MRRTLPVLTAAFMLLALLAPAAQAHYPAEGNFGIEGFDVTFTEGDHTMATQAGSHPFAMTTTFGVNLDGSDTPEGWIRDFFGEQVPGFVADTTAYPRCATAEFLVVDEIESKRINECKPDTQVGIAAASVTLPGAWHTSAVFNLVPPPGVLARLGFTVEGVNVIIDAGLNPATENALATSRNTPQIVKFFAAQIQLWGVPSSSDHDQLRGLCGIYGEEGLPKAPDAFALKDETGQSCGLNSRISKPFLTLPTTCAEALSSSFEAFSWEGPSALDDGFDAGSRPIHDAGGNPQPFSGCGSLPFHPTIAASPTTKAAQSASGLDFSLDVLDEGLTSVKPGATSASDIEKTVVTLPKGMTVNPSQAEGLEVCSEADLQRETLAAEPGEGCPQASKVGTIETESPLVAGILKGSLFIAKPYENLAGDSLIAVYVVIKDPGLGVLVKQPIKVEPDPLTGQLVSTAADMPQLPFSSFRLHFREGGRAPLISPPGCGTFETKAVLYPYSGGAPVESSSSFQIVSGPDGGSCPQGAAPFHPDFEAGTVNNAAGRYSPFYMRISRKDGEQDITRLSFVLPPGVVAKIAGVPYCPEAGIARAISRTGAHGGAEELADPSCPAASQIGRTQAAAGVGSQLTYVPGRLYLAGPFHGDPLSVVSVTPAVAGPYDAGTVVVRAALTLNPATGEAELDGSASDPIPHILKGIPLNVRDLRVYVDKPEFSLNATSCAEEQARATLFGGGTVLAPAHDSPFGLQARYQAADCAALGFQPKMSIRLNGGTRRGAFPRLRAVYTPRPGDANLKSLALQFPHSEFIEQGHFRTICTRVQYAAGAGHGSQCPADSIYGHVRAWSPLLDEPLAGPVFLRSSSHNLPDAIFSLHGVVDIEVVVRIDSIHGRLRATVESAPDAPVSKAIVDMQGGQRGLFVNSTNLCLAKHHARLKLTAQSGKLSKLEPPVQNSCQKHGKHARRRRHRGA